MILVHLHGCKKIGDNNKYIVDSVDCNNSQNNYQNACVILYNHTGETMYYRIVTNRVKTGRIYGSSTYNYTYSEYDSAKSSKNFIYVSKSSNMEGAMLISLNKNQGVGIYEFDPSVQQCSETGTKYSFDDGSIPTAFTMSGNADWLANSTYAFKGSYSVGSGSISSSQTSCIQATSINSGNLGFFSRVSSESNYDWFRLYLNGSEETNARLSGEVDWQPYCVEVDANTIIKWCFEKDSLGSSGSDQAWLDEITLP